MSSPTAHLHVAEPPAHYLLRPPLVVDCSVMAGAVFEEHWVDEATRRIEGHAATAPFLLQAEMTNVALKKARQGFADLARQGLDTFAALDIKYHPIHAADVLALAQRYQLSAYDASYLWLAAELQCPLATFDDKLATAARAHLSSLP